MAIACFFVSIPKRVLEALNPIDAGLNTVANMFQSLKGF